VGQITLVAGASIALLAAACILYRRLQEQNRRLSTALNNMSQGLNMFDAQGRIILLNKRYLQMYKLSPEVVKPGCTLKRLIEYRKETGLFAGDIDSYVKNILEAMSLGKSLEHYVKASDGRIVLAKNEPLPGGGWVSTHEDVTEQRRAEEERAAIRGQEQTARKHRLGHRVISANRRKASVHGERKHNRNALDLLDAFRLL
jgi:PAS domain-containing protein